MIRERPKKATIRGLPGIRPVVRQLKVKKTPQERKIFSRL